MDNTASLFTTITSDTPAKANTLDTKADTTAASNNEMDTEMPDVSPPSSLTRSDQTPTNTDPPASNPTNTSPLANPTDSGGAGSTPSSRNIQLSTTSTTQLQDQPEAITESQKDPSMTAKDPTGYSDSEATSKAAGKLPEVSLALSGTINSSRLQSFSGVYTCATRNDILRLYLGGLIVRVISHNGSYIPEYPAKRD